MIEVIVVGPVELIGEDELIINIVGSECEEELKDLIEEQLDNSLDDDVASTLMLEPVCPDIRSFTGTSENLSDETFMMKIELCSDWGYVNDFEDFLYLCSELGFVHTDDPSSYYIGYFESNRELCENFLEYELSQTDSLIENNINWDTLYDDISYDVHSNGNHYMRAH